MPLLRARGGTAMTYDPISPARQAAALEAAIAATAANACNAGSSCKGSASLSVLSAGADGPLGVPRLDNYGGINAEVLPTVFYDPRALTSRAPRAVADPDASDAAVSGVPGAAHGPSPFFVAPGDLEAATTKRAQFAPHGPIPLPEPLILEPLCGACGCVTCVGVGPFGGPYPYSMAALLLSPTNALYVRGLLEAQGIVRVSPALRAQRRPLCACAALGGGATYAGFALFASRFEDAPIATTPEPGAKAKQLDAAYVEQVLGGIRAQVIAAARMNYLRVESQRAFLQPLPALPYGGDDDAADAALAALPAPLPEYLPSGVRTCAEDSPFVSLGLNIPLASARNKAILACATGLPIGRAFPAT